MHCWSAAEELPSTDKAQSDFFYASGHNRKLSLKNQSTITAAYLQHITTITRYNGDTYSDGLGAKARWERTREWKTFTEDGKQIVLRLCRMNVHKNVTDNKPTNLIVT